MIVLLLVLIVAVFLIRQFPEHPTLRPAAVALAVITSIQVMLGFTTFMMLILFPETSLAVMITSVLHVTTGSLTFAAGMALAILIHYNIGAGTVTPRSVTAKVTLSGWISPESFDTLMTVQNGVYGSKW